MGRSGPATTGKINASRVPLFQLPLSPSLFLPGGGGENFAIWLPGNCNALAPPSAVAGTYPLALPPPSRIMVSCCIYRSDFAFRFPDPVTSAVASAIGIYVCRKPKWLWYIREKFTNRYRRKKKNIFDHLRVNAAMVGSVESGKERSGSDSSTKRLVLPA